MYKGPALIVVISCSVYQGHKVWLYRNRKRLEEVCETILFQYLLTLVTPYISGKKSLEVPALKIQKLWKALGILESKNLKIFDICGTSYKSDIFTRIDVKLLSKLLFI